MTTTSHDTINGFQPEHFAPWLAADSAQGSMALTPPAEISNVATNGRPDHDTVVRIYRAHHADLLRFATLVAPEDGHAEDLVQEAFVRLYRSWTKVTDHERLGGYLRITVLNLARARGRRLGVARRKREEPRPDAASAEQHAMTRLGGDSVVAAIRGLARRQRECLVLRYYEGFTESEIAEALGVSVGSVRTHLHRGTAALRSSLAGVA